MNFLPRSHESLAGSFLSPAYTVLAVRFRSIAFNSKPGGACPWFQQTAGRSPWRQPCRSTRCSPGSKKRALRLCSWQQPNCLPRGITRNELHGVIDGLQRGQKTNLARWQQLSSKTCSGAAIPAETDPPGELMYIVMSWFGSVLAR